MELYWASGSPYSWRVMLGLLFKDLDYDDILLSLSDREHKQAGYTALNPRAKVPALVDGDVVVTESIAILAYLDHVYRRNPLFGSAGHEAARIWQRTMALDAYLVGASQPVVRALFMGRWSQDIPGLKRKVVTVREELDTLEKAGGLGGPFTAADCVLLPALKSLERASLKSGASNLGLLPFDLRRWPNIAARVAEIEAVDGYERTLPPHWR
jgi:glutathione S-transferase